MDEFDTKLRKRLVALAGAASSGAPTHALLGRPNRMRARSALPAGIIAMLLVVVAAAVVAGPQGTSKPSPSASPSASQSASPASSPSGTPSPAGPTFMTTPRIAALAHFTTTQFLASDSFSFDYPASWHVINTYWSLDDEPHNIGYGPVVGNGDWHLPCTAMGLPASVCDMTPVWTIPAGGVVVEFSYSLRTTTPSTGATPGVATTPGPALTHVPFHLGGGPVPDPNASHQPDATPYPNSLQLRNGLFAFLTQTPTTVVWQLLFPHHTYYPWYSPAFTVTLEAHYDAAYADEARTQVRALVESIRYPWPNPIATPTPTIAPGDALAFLMTGPMSTPRGSETATLLRDGRVLVAGGEYTLTSAEIYDPSRGTFSATGSLHVGRADHTATLLQDGRVLIAGGLCAFCAYNADLASAELYDPQTGKFTTTGSMITGRAFHTATLLPDGRVLVTGGLSDARLLASAEIYDPRTGRFTSTGSMVTQRYNQTATLLHDGRVLVAGGVSAREAVPIPCSAELYDPATGKFTPTGSMIAHRQNHTATLLSDGRVLIAGGAVDTSTGAATASAEIYDPSTGTFSATGLMNDSRYRHSAAALADGRVLVLGGFDEFGDMLASAEVYDPTTGRFSRAGAMYTTRTDFCAVALSDGRVLVVGGYIGSGYLASAEVIAP
jgi:hypothetical protein